MFCIIFTRKHNFPLFFIKFFHIRWFEWYSSVPSRGGNRKINSKTQREERTNLTVKQSRSNWRAKNGWRLFYNIATFFLRSIFLFSIVFFFRLLITTFLCPAHSLFPPHCKRNFIDSFFILSPLLSLVRFVVSERVERERETVVKKKIKFSSSQMRERKKKRVKIQCYVVRGFLFTLSTWNA